ncbi:MAG: hypothetical protein JXR96_27185 [Deltaproteobacteria bacterium]|nr:hypothetical protein [Deltaproteobacteria bacterium]
MESSEHAPTDRNVYVKMELSMGGPALPDRGGSIEIWLRGERFRVRDHTGRMFGEICADLVARRGLGEPPATIEEIMDIHGAALRPRRDAVQLFGDLATQRGWVATEGEEPWPIPATKLAGIAHQIFAGEPAASLERVGSPTRLGRPCVEYRGLVDGETQGVAWQNQVHRIVSPPYLLLDDVRAAKVPDWYYVREVVELVEGHVADAEVRPPDDR